MNTRDPYDREKLIDACSNHAWDRRSDEFIKHGINSEDELRCHISNVIEDTGTNAFRCQPQRDREQTLCREIYDLPTHHIDGKDCNTTVILNPNQDGQGNYYGGSCWIRDSSKNEFDRLSRREAKESGENPEIVIGGRSALREQELTRQLAIYENPAHATDQSPTEVPPSNLHQKQEISQTIQSPRQNQAVENEQPIVHDEAAARVQQLREILKEQEAQREQSQDKGMDR